MKKLLCLLLVLAMVVSFATMFTVSAEDAATPKFVVDGELDQYYRDDAWAAANQCYFYFNSIDDTTMPIISRDPSVGGIGELDLPMFYEETKVKIYAAYDDQYAYFYVDVDDPYIATSYTDSNGKTSDVSQYIENIDFYIDTDPMSCTGKFNENEPSDIDADTHFRLIAHNLVVTDTQGNNNKYIFQDQPLNDPTGNKSASNYFSCSENTVAKHKTDAQGNLTGYVCETRVPLAHNYAGYENYSSFYYNIGVTNAANPKEDDIVCTISTGYRWWLAYDTGKTVVYDTATPNPFFYPADENKTAADIVTTLINQLDDPDIMEDWQAYEVEEVIAAYEKLTDVQKELVDPAACEKLVACAAKVGLDWPEPITPPAPAVVYGDVDGDEKVTASDALEVLKSVVGKVTFDEAQNIAADVNGDQKTDAADALEILKKVVGKIEKFAVEA